MKRPYSEWTPEQKLRLRAYVRDWRRRNPELIRGQNLRRRLRLYGLTAAELAHLEQRIGGLCPVCRLRPADCVDHEHETGRVRGLLCKLCNTGIGALGDSVAGLEAALEYLRRAV